MKYEFTKDVYYKGQLTPEGTILEIPANEIPSLKHCVVPHVEKLIEQQVEEPVKPIKKTKA
jgi:hypothetical protein